MTTAMLTPLDVRLRDAVVHQLDFDPEVDASAIGVSAKDGIVTLTGFADSYIERIAAERVTKRVKGVRAVANDVIVRVSVARTDTDIARDAADALKATIGLDPVQAAVHYGQITLTGHAGSTMRKRQAERTVRDIKGVLGVINEIEIEIQESARPGESHWEPIDEEC